MAIKDLALVAGSPLMPTATAIAQSAIDVDRRPVDRRTQRALSGDATDQTPELVDDGCHRKPLTGQPVVDLVGRRAVLDHHAGRCSSRSSVG